ncbi:MAG: radical SAM protein [Armatimonadota bacterium]
MQPYRRQVLAEEVHVYGTPAASGRLRIALLFPADYAVGMANLALQGLYRLFSTRPEVLCERAFYPGIPEQGRPRDGTLRSLEHDTALGAFDAIAISSSFELDWLNIPAALREGGVEPFAHERGPDQPVVIIGGPAVTSNPQPLAPFADALFVGEVEPVFGAMVDALLDPEDAPGRLAQLPGFVVPAVQHSPTVKRVALDGLDAAPTTSAILTPRSEFPDTFLIETGRGCPRGCRFCLARRIYHPVRSRSAESIIDSARLGLRFTDRIGLVGASVGDHPQIEQIASAIVALGGQISTSSLRAESVTPELMAMLAAGGQRTITLAPETADPELAAVLGKPMRVEAVRSALDLAAAAGLSQAKLYFMVGIPGETDAAALQIADYVAALEAEFGGLRFSVSIGVLSPKPHTELARAAVPDPGLLDRRLRELRSALRSRTRAHVTVASPHWAAVQTVLSRGGRELAPVMAAAAGGGPGDFTRALEAEGLALRDYLAEQTGPAPWEIVSGCCLMGPEL